MSAPENYRGKQAVLVIVVFCLFGLAFMGGSWVISVGSLLAVAAVVLFASTTQPAPTHNDHHH